MSGVAGSTSSAEGEAVAESFEYHYRLCSGAPTNASTRTANMPCLLYPPAANETTEPTYAVGHLEPVDENILQDLRRWGWGVESTTNDDPKWLAAKQNYPKRMDGEGDACGEKESSPWEYWRDENAWRVAKENGKDRERRRLTESPRLGTPSSHRRSLMRLVSWKGSPKLPDPQGGPRKEDNKGEETLLMSGANQEGKSIAEIRRQTAQKKEASGGWNRPELAKSFGLLDPQRPSIYNYGSDIETSAAATAQLEREILREIAEWIGIEGILRTTQVSVVFEEGICIDDKGERVSFPPR
jgi:hypothetical protein